MGVPAQELGEMIGTERVSGSNIVVHQSLKVFNDRIRRLRTLIDPVIESMGLKFRVSVPAHILEQLIPIAKTEWAKEMIAVTYDVPEEAIDATLLRKKQEMLLGDGNGGGGQPESGDDPEGARRLKRRKKNEADRLRTEAMKAEGREAPSGANASGS